MQHTDWGFLVNRADPMNCALFVRSYWKDLGWLQFCLESVQRYCRGFSETVVVIPRSSEPWLRRVALPSVGRIEVCSDYRDDYLGQQVTKLMADTFTDADFICHVDSDCVFTRPTVPEDFIVDNRACIYRRPIGSLSRERPWHAPTEKFLGWRVHHDFMYHPPFTFPRWLFPMVRQHAVAMHGVDLGAYVMRQPPRGFSEFNVLGAFAWDRCRSSFVWMDAPVSPPADPQCRWYWSWGGLDAATTSEIENILGTA